MLSSTIFSPERGEVASLFSSSANIFVAHNLANGTVAITKMRDAGNLIQANFSTQVLTNQWNDFNSNIVVNSSVPFNVVSSSLVFETRSSTPLLYANNLV